MSKNPEMQQLQDKMQDIYRQFSEIPNRRLPEHIFVKNFLPVFIGYKSIEDYPDFVSTWISVAGSPTAQLDIIDHTGTVVFTVPSLFDVSHLNPNANKDNMDFKQIIALSTLYSNISPAQGQNFLQNKLHDRLEALKTKSENFTDYEKKWLFIFKRYEKLIESVRPKEVEKEKVNTKVATSNISDDDFE